MSTVEHVFRWPSTHADEVYVSGSFDGWTQRHELRREGGGFAVACPVPPGKVYYKFIVDGEWCTSAEDRTECDEHGNVNNVVVYCDDTDAAVLVHDSDGSSEFTSISHPASETRWEEVVEEDVGGGGGDDDLTSSVQITLRDTSSVTASIQSRTAPQTKQAKQTKQDDGSGGESFMGRIRSIFRK